MADTGQRDKREKRDRKDKRQIENVCVCGRERARARARERERGTLSHLGSLERESERQKDREQTDRKDK